MNFYEHWIEQLEAEIAVQELVHSVLENQSPGVFTIETDCWQAVEELCRLEKVIFMRIKWSWKYFRRVWVVQYIKKHGRECYSSHQNTDGSY